MDYYIYFCGAVATFGCLSLVGKIGNKINFIDAIIMSLFFPITVPTVLLFGVIKIIRGRENVK